MTPGTDIPAAVTPPALPGLPGGYRWVIDKKAKLRANSWGDSWTYRGLGIVLQKQVTKKFGRGTKWKALEARELERGCKGDWVGGIFEQETLVQCAERLAREICDQHIELLKMRLEEESLIGVYE